MFIWEVSSFAVRGQIRRISFLHRCRFLWFTGIVNRPGFLSPRPVDVS